MSSARRKQVAVAMALAFGVGACATTTMDSGSSAPLARTAEGIFLGKTGPHPVQALPERPRFGQPVSEADLVAVNIDVRTPDGLGLPPGRGSVAAGKQVYDTKCAACHGPEAKGNPALGSPNLTDGVWLYGSSIETITETIVKGRAGRMPAHREFLGEERVHILAAYVYGLSEARKGDVVKVNATR